MKKIIVISLTAIICFCGGLFTARIFKPSSLPAQNCYTQQDIDTAYSKGREEISGRLIDSELVASRKDEMAVYEISGTIKSFDNNNIVLITSSLDPSADPGLDNRNILIPANAKLYRYEKLSEEEYQKKLDEFTRRYQAGSLGADELSPARYEKRAVETSALGAGQNIIVVSEEDLRSQKQISAKEITIYPVGS